MPTPARTILLDEVLWEDWSRVEVSRQGVAVSVTLLPTSPNFEPAFGTPIEVRLGRTTAAGPELVTVAAGRVAGRRRTRRWSADDLQLAVDATDRRLQIAPPEPLRFERASVTEILFRVYVETLGFTDVVSNIEDFVVESWEIPTTAAYHAAMQGLLSGFSPKSFHDPLTDAWCIWDTRFPVPEGLPVRELPLGVTISYGDDYPVPTIVNAVRISYYDDTLVGQDTGYHPFTEETRRPEAEETPEGFTLAQTIETWRLYREDPQQPTRVTREVLRKRKQEVYDRTGELASVVETTIRYYPGTYDRLPEREDVRKWARVQLATGGFELLLTKHERKHKRWRFDLDVRDYVEVGEWTETEGEVLLPDLVPLDEGSREGLSGRGGEQYPVWMQIEHGHVTLTEIGDTVNRIATVWDDLNGGVKIQEDVTYVGQLNTQPGRVEATSLYLDEASIALWGRRPEVSFDGKDYGLDLSKRLVDAHLFGGYASTEPTASAELLKSDPTWYPGQLARYTDRDDSTSLWLVTAVTDTDDYAGRETKTVLSLERVVEAV